MLDRLLFCIFLSVISFLKISAEESVVITDIKIQGHRKTRERVILRELTFQKGDTLLLYAADQRIALSRENLLNTSLFNYVTINQKESSPGNLEIEIVVEERWYTWPAVILKYEDRNFSAWLKAGDLSKSLYGVSIDQYNCFGRKENLKLSVLSGYANQFAISYKNIALDRSRKHFIGADVELSRQDEIIIKTVKNEPVTFNNSFRTVFERQKYTINYLFRPLIHDRHNFYFNFIKYNAADTLIALNPSFLLNGKSKLDCFTLDYVYTKDKRDLKAYPLRGSFFEVLIGQTVSLGTSEKRFSSTVIVPSYYKYLEINDKLHFATGFNFKISFTNENSFLYSRSLGYIYNMHGFEYNTIEGQHFFIIKNLFKITLLQPKISELKFIPFRKFNKIHYALYLNIFNDLGYVSDRYKSADNTYSNKFLASAGAGIDLVTYYDRTFRFEYAINGFGKSGFFLHLAAPLNK
jgi:outer membrane protein assembly factor BamA